ELYTFDCYFVTDNVFNVCDIRIIVSNNMLAEAINKLPCDLRDIVLLSYFANMPDIEIAKQLDLSYWIVFRARIRALKRLKAIISTEGIK
ncbi:MAG: sigma factor-like helix-turn-helix DNA-binding protein, partial [Clostridia bacterium]|nr:sigma factor-like helix-turn-helix DNA-binding protein [Clostridia bacterium]